MKNIVNIKSIKLALITACLGFIATACTEDINTDARFTLKQYTVYSYLTESPDSANYKEYTRLLRKVPISSRSSSTVAQLLSARGKYTCFAPDNKAIQDYLDSLYAKGIIPGPNWESITNAATLDSIEKVIVLNSVIDGSRNGEIYEMGTISSKADHDELPTANLYDRKLYKTSIEHTDSIFMNGVAMIDLDNRDIKTINGRVHEVHAVIAPSNDTMADIFRQRIAEKKRGYLVMSKLILACGLEDTLSRTRDDVWDRLYLNNEVADLPKHPTEQIGTIPEHRKYGFTIFAEPDDLWEAEIGKDATEITVEDVKEYLISKGAYPNASTDNNYASEKNIINQFTTYHILPEKLSRDRLVIHYNENGYYWKTSGTNYTIPVYEYFTTMGKRRLLKIFESAESDGIYLNRFPILRNGRGEYGPDNLDINDYHESGKFRDIGSSFAMYPDENVGNKIFFNESGDAQHENLINGCIYPIERMLVYTENVQRRLSGERIRIDMAAMFPEMMNNDIRRPLSNYPTGETQTRGFVQEYPYLADVQMQEGTLFYYFSGHDRGWSNYQMDEFNIIGQYEFTMKLPPVPSKGHYEIRFGVSSGSSYRSMCQVYFGDNLNYLPAAGIPMDLRIGFVNHRFRGGNQASNFGYTNNSEYEAEANLPLEDQDEITKSLRARGFMKGPKYFHIGNGTSAQLGNQGEWVTRRIMVSADLDPDKTYYIRFKNVLNDNQSQFFMDYFEFVSKDVYDNPVEPEDIW